MFSWAFLKKNSAVLLCFLFLTLIIYGQSLSGDFVYDDRGIVEHSASISNPSNLGQIIMHPYWERENGLYRPITLVSYTFNLAIFGDSPFSFHLFNLALYVFICFLIYLLIKKLSGNALLAFFTGLLFLVLPIHTEVVANITGRSELLSLFFSLLLLLEFTKEKPNFWLSGIWMLLAIGAKETALAALPLSLIVIYIKDKKLNLDIIKKCFRSLSAAFVGVCLYFFLRYFSLGPANFFGIHTSLIENPLMHTSSIGRIATSFKILSMYVSKTFWPVNLCSDYSYNQIPIIHNFLNPGAFLGLAIFCISIILFFVFWRRQPLISLGLGIFLFAFLPISNLLFPIGTIAGERLFFFPSFGFVIIISFILVGITKILKSSKAGIIFLILLISILTGYSIASTKRQSVWLNEENLFTNAAMCAPNSVLSRSNLGAIYLLKEDLNKAEIELELSRAINPTYSKGLNNLGLVYFKQGENDKALKLYQEALSQEFPYSGTLENLVLLYLKEQKYDTAKQWIMIAYGLDEQSAEEAILEYKKKEY
jgi:tetratricopeptide (TPR) repeat protein